MIMKDEELQIRLKEQESGHSSLVISRNNSLLLDQLLAVREERDFLRRRVAELETVLLEKVFLSGRNGAQAAASDTISDLLH